MISAPRPNNEGNLSRILQQKGSLNLQLHRNRTLLPAKTSPGDTRAPNPIFDCDQFDCDQFDCDQQGRSTLEFAAWRAGIDALA
jgi:hypothetical protein